MRKLLTFLLTCVVAIHVSIAQQASPTKAGITKIVSGTSLTNFSGNDLPSQMNSLDMAIGIRPVSFTTITSLALYAGNSAIYDGTLWTRISGTTTTSTVGYGAVLTNSVGGFYFQRVIESGINVKWFGAKGTGLVDDSPAINNAIAYAKNLAAGNGGALRHEVKFPSGVYRLLSTINITNSTGVFLTGSEGEYVNVTINGNTGGIIFDFTGAILGGCKGFSFISDKNDSNPSRIGVQFALSQDGSGNQLGGLNNKISNCFFQMDDNPTFNGGLGTIGLVNVRSEEFSARDLLVKANVGMLFTNQQTLVPFGVSSFSITSPYATVMTGSGSMGVTHISGTSIENTGRRQPALLLNNVNSFHFDGYMSDGQFSTAGTNDLAIKLVGQADGIDIKATVETFPQLVKFADINTQVNMQIIFGTVRNPTVPVMDATNSSIIDSEIGITFNDPSMFNNGRFFLYHANTGDAPTTTGVQGCKFKCSRWVDNTNFVSANLLRNTSNTDFLSGQPFQKINNAVRDLKSYRKLIGTTTGVSKVLTATIINFVRADKATTTTGNGGYYQVKVYGQVQAGQYGTGGNCMVDFESTISVSQNQNGALNAIATKTIIYNKSLTSPAYVDITNISADMVFNGVLCNVKLNITLSGTANGDGIYFSGYTQVASDFLVNQSVILD